MPSKSKTKGKTFEREVCKYLSLLYDSSFTRVFDSGAFIGGSNSYRKQALSENQIRSRKGDIIPPDEWIMFNAECKSYAEFPFHQLLSNKPIALLETWVEQALEPADESDCTVIFMKFNRKGKFIAFDPSDGFSSNRHIDYTALNGTVWRITDFEEFFALNKEKFENRCISG